MYTKGPLVMMGQYGYTTEGPARLCHTFGPRSGGWCGMARTKEDAVLYAAAPELLEAMEAILARADLACLVESDHPHSDFADEFRAAIAAIAKAKEG